MSAALAYKGARKECTAAALPESLKQMYPLCLPHCLKSDSDTCLAAKPVLQRAQGRGRLWDNPATALTGSSQVRMQKGSSSAFLGVQLPVSGAHTETRCIADKKVSCFLLPKRHCC